ncbi:MAG: class I SAM-dependent methyltransferase [bacterium]
MQTYLLIGLIIILGTFVYANIRAIGWVPMKSKDIAKVLELADLKPNETFCDLGCGDGKLIMAAGQKAQALGYDISIPLYIVAKIRSFFSKGKVQVKLRDFWLVNLENCDVVFFFLIPRIFPKMKEKLEKELKTGARVIIYVWPMPGWKINKVFKNKNDHSIYLYKIGDLK